MIRRTLIVLAAAVLALPALAQDAFPSKPLKIVSPFPPGGTSDVMARLIAEPLGRELGRQVLVENIGGAGGTVGTLRAVKQLPADGCTVIQTGVGQSAVAHGLNPGLGYDSNKDFVHPAQVHSGANVLVVNPGTPWKSFKELVDYVRSNPGKLNYGYTHAASGHMAMELFKLEGSKCAPSVKDCKGLFMVGIPNFQALSWSGLSAAKGTLQPIVDRLEAALRKVMTAPEIKHRLETLGFVVPAPGGASYAKFVPSEIDLWTRVIKTAGIKPE